jgi:transmembrane sensor
MSRANASAGELRIMDEAADWVARLREESVTEQDIAAWLSWCDSDERHRKAFDDAQRFWRDVGDLATGPQAAKRLQELRGPDPVAVPERGARRTQMFVMAASVALAIIGLLAWQYLAHQPQTLTAGDSTAVERKTLPDGSTVELAAKSAVDVRYTEQQRLLELRPGGEAYFSVQPNPARPFIVSVGDHRVRAVGTAFNVRSAGDRVIVTVDEGTVDVFRASDPQPRAAADTMRVSAGNEAKWIDPQTAVVVRPVDPARALAWRQGRLEYIDEPLAAVLADINRYSDRPVVVEQGAVDDLAFTGTVFATSVDEWLRALPGEFPVSLIVNGERELRLVRKNR